FRYRSFDGEEIAALVYRPPQARPEERLPAVLVFRERLEGQHALEWNPFIQLASSHGYLVFAPNVRGSSGRGRDYRHAVYGLGGELDVRDALVGLDRLSADGIVDPARVAVFGAGTGASLAAAALARDGARFQAAVLVQGAVDLTTAAAYPAL